MDKILIVGVGGFLGACARYLLSGAAQRLHGGTFPLGTLAVNVLGCLLIGVAMAVAEERSLLGPNARLFIMMGLLGSFTTFSTFGYETVELLRDGELRWALYSAAANFVLGVGAVVAGRFLTKTAGI